MTLPEPQSGLVIRYSYLWAREADAGREEGAKDRPCAVLLARRTDEGTLRVIVLPITHSPPAHSGDAIEIPLATKRRLGLDEGRSFVMLTEGNAFAWPGPDLRFLSGRGPESVAIGFLPAKLFEGIRDAFVVLHRHRRAKIVMRSD